MRNPCVQDRVRVSFHILGCDFSGSASSLRCRQGCRAVPGISVGGGRAPGQMDGGRQQAAPRGPAPLESAEASTLHHGARNQQTRPEVRPAGAKPISASEKSSSRPVSGYHTLKTLSFALKRSLPSSPRGDGWPARRCCPVRRTARSLRARPRAAARPVSRRCPVRPCPGPPPARRPGSRRSESCCRRFPPATGGPRWPGISATGGRPSSRSARLARNRTVVNSRCRSGTARAISALSCGNSSSPGSCPSS